jgi:hypothetical protein
MKGTIISLDADGTETVTEVTGEPKYELIKEAIGGGSLEVVPFFSRYVHKDRWVSCVAFCDEEGKLHGLPFNQHATEHWEKSLKANGHPGLIVNGGLVDHLVGKIAILYGDEAFMRAI